jgi:integrative and conjugative element protein (TIGR02256 family)
VEVWLAHAAYKAILNEACARHPLESGGMLLGWRAGQSKVVVGIIGPGLNALHGRTRFFPDHEWQIRELKRIFSESAGDIDYLGDWHSHPEGTAAMSGEDYLTLRRISIKVADPLMLIVANPSSKDCTLGCWEGSLRKRRLFTRQLDVTTRAVRLFVPSPDWPAIEHPEPA